MILSRKMYVYFYENRAMFLCQICLLDNKKGIFVIT